MKLALALIIKNTDEEAELLENGLSASYFDVDGIFITTTPKSEDEPTSPRLLELAKDWNATISRFVWRHDFAAARNFNFSQVPEDYTHILWMDADDAIRGADKIRETITKNPDVDVFYLTYLYAFDEERRPTIVHQKAQIVKRGCVEWVGRLHEDFRPLRSVINKYIKGIERLHLSTPEHFESAKGRNLEVALAQVLSDPDDPRSYWNLGNSYSALGESTKAIHAFDTFLEKSQSDDEKYIARIRRAEAYMLLGDKDKALAETQYAIGLKPMFPDAYHLAGNILYSQGKWDKAATMYRSGLSQPPPNLDILVFNPRSYDYDPMINLAKCYFQMSMPTLALPLIKGAYKVSPSPSLKKLVTEMTREAKNFDEVVALIKKLGKIADKEKLRTALAKIPKKYQSHPAVCNLRNNVFIKKTSSGKDISIYCGFTEEVWNPITAKTKGIGGSEEAVIWLSRLLTQMGWNVDVYNNCGYATKKYDGVTYHPFWEFNHRDKTDILWIWRSPKLCDYELNASKIIVDVHDVIPPGEFTPERLKKIDHVFVKSKFHKSLFPNVPDEKFVVIPNGIDSQLFAGEFKKDPNLVINTSSPDRSIEAFCEIAERVKKVIPEAKFKWAYGWNVFTPAHANDSIAMKWKEGMEKKMVEVGVEELGRLGHDEVAKMYQDANIFLYPSEFAEIDCISLSKSMAAGAIPVTTDFSAMGDKAGHGGYFYHSDKTKDTWGKTLEHSVHDDKMIAEMSDKVIELIRHPETNNGMRQWAQKTFDWNHIAKVWDGVFNESNG
jgi:glycosyltransferase involved in cell wall biosynthesis